ncbi:MAG: PAC2 family protein [Acidimicrobiales bacterium]
MQSLRWEQDMTLRRPILVVAFEGWNDAGEAASLAASYLARAWRAEPVATIDAEEFYDFTSTRPEVAVGEDSTRAIIWPDTEILGARIPGSHHDLVIVRGVEPQLRWKTFCALVVEAAVQLGAEMAITLGALLADVPHSAPARVSGASDDRELAERLCLVRPRYEGPTGIIGVLSDAFSASGIPTASLWAAVPHYVHQLTSPKAALALVERSSGLLGAPVDAHELRVAARDYERRVDERIADDAEAAAYVAALESQGDADWGEVSEEESLPLEDSHSLAAEVEQFLEDHRSSD